MIYQLTDDIQQALVGMLSPVKTEETIGEAEVRALFRVSRLGTIAGCMVTQGVIRRNAQVRIVRDGTVIHETSIAQLKRFKDDVREVAEGFECGILLDGFNDVKEGDVLEAFEIREVERTEPTTRGAALRPRNRASRGDPSVALGHEQAFATGPRRRREPCSRRRWDGRRRAETSPGSRRRGLPSRRFVVRCCPGRAPGARR